MADIAPLTFWQFVEERLNICTRRRRGIVPLTDGKILATATGVFAKVVPGLDDYTVKMHQLLVTRPTVVPSIFALIYIKSYNF
jgi:hypothetical protein